MHDDEQDGVVLGHFLSDGEPAFLSDRDRRNHVYVIGKSGTGKSTLLLAMMASDLRRGRGFGLLDPHGDLAVAIAGAARPERTIYLDPSDSGFHLGFNPLHNVPPDRRALVSSQVVEAFAHIWGSTIETAPRMTYLMGMALRLLLDAPGSTMLGLPRLLTVPDYRNRLIAHARDPVLRAFWLTEWTTYSDKFASEAVSPILNKVNALLGPPAIRNILGQVRPTIDIRRLMDEGKILILNLSKGNLGPGPSHLLGALFATGFAQAAQSRADIPEEERRDFTLYADELQNFATASFSDALSEARKFRLQIVAGHQFLGQLPEHLRLALIGNASTLVCFRVGAEDAPLLAAELGLGNPSTLVEIANHHAWTKFTVNGLPTDPRPIATVYPQIARGRLDAVRNATRATYLRPRKWVEDRIARFLAPPKKALAPHARTKADTKPIQRKKKPRT